MTDLLAPPHSSVPLVPWTGLTVRSAVFDDSGLPDTEAIDVSAIIAADRHATRLPA